MTDLRKALEKKREGMAFAHSNDGPYRESFEEGFTAALDLLLPCVEEQVKFCAKFSPGDNWFPEMRNALTTLRARIEKGEG